MQVKTKPDIYWSSIDHDEWSFIIAATSRGLCYVGSQDKPLEELIDWAKRRCPESQLIQDDVKLHPYITQFIEFFKGVRTDFTTPFDLHGTPFQLAVWHALCSIPYGQTRSYAELAQDIQKPTSTRAVGAAIGANPILITVPCHRVIGKNGSLTGYRGGLQMKSRLLDLERSQIRGRQIEYSCK